MSEWQPIETALKDWTDVLLYDPHTGPVGAVSQGYYSLADGGFDRWVCYLYECPEPTHWMPIPKPPTE